MNRSESDSMHMLHGIERLNTLVKTKKSVYDQNMPFKHLVIDGFMKESALRQVLDDFPAMESKNWLNYQHLNSNKHGLSRFDEMPNSIQQLLSYLNSDIFVKFLSELSGFDQLKSDPDLDGGGLHQSAGGGYLKIHADFTAHPKRKNWRRRLNLILYLNENWKEEYGGHLELWSEDMKRCVQRIAPIFNRCVIFNTHETSWHGHPDPIACPDGMSRKSIALYYFTEENEPVIANSTSYRQRPQEDRSKVLLRIDNFALRVYKKLIAVLGIDDSFLSSIIGKFKPKK